MKTTSAAECSRQLLLAIPQLMQDIRQSIRTGHDSALTLPQFRVLSTVQRSPGMSLSSVAVQIGLGAPSTSVLIDGLVRRGLLVRRNDVTNRRRMRLEITPEGESQLERSRDAARIMLTEKLSNLSGSELDALSAGIAIIDRVFIPAEPLTGSARNRS